MGVKFPNLTYIGSVTDSADATTYSSNFTAVNIGNAQTDRLVVVCVQGLHTATRTISSVTINGNTMSTAATTAANNSQSGIYYYAVPTGTTAAIVVTFSGSNSRCTLHVYTITGLTSQTPTDTDHTVSTTGTSINRTLTISENGVAIGVAWVANSPSTVSWTNLTKDSGVTNELQQFSSASAENMAANAGLTITATGTGSSGNCIIAVASWR